MVRLIISDRMKSRCDKRVKSGECTEQTDSQGKPNECAFNEKRMFVRSVSF